MTKTKLIYKHRLLNLSFYKKEIKYIFYKSLYENKSISYSLRFYIYYNYLNILNIKNIKLFCILTGNSRSRYNFFNISRIKIRDLASFRNLNGLRKSS